VTQPGQNVGAAAATLIRAQLLGLTLGAIDQVVNRCLTGLQQSLHLSSSLIEAGSPVFRELETEGLNQRSAIVRPPSRGVGGILLVLVLVLVSRVMCVAGVIRHGCMRRT
jgi:hypothetical protein